MVNETIRAQLVKRLIKEADWEAAAKCLEGSDLLEDVNWRWNLALIYAEMSDLKREQDIYREMLEIPHLSAEFQQEVLYNLCCSYLNDQNNEAAAECSNRLDWGNLRYDLKTLLSPLTNLENPIEDTKWTAVRGRLGNDQLSDLMRPIIEKRSVYESSLKMNDAWEDVTISAAHLLDSLNNGRVCYETSEFSQIAATVNRFSLAYHHRDREYSALVENYQKIQKILLGLKPDENHPWSKKSLRQFRMAVITTARYHHKLFCTDQFSNKNDVELIVLNNKAHREDSKIFRKRYDISLNEKNLEQVWHFLRDQHYSAVFIPEVGMSIECQLLALLKPIAPIVATSWLHPVSTFSNAITHFILPYQMRCGSHEKYSEELIETRGFGLNLARLISETPLVPEIDHFKADEIRIGSIQMPFKYHPDDDHLYADLLKVSTRIKLYFVSHPNRSLSGVFFRRLKGVMRAAGVDFENRVTLLPFMPKRQFNEMLKTFHFVLDTPRWSGGNTSLDSVLQGVPVVTFEGGTVRSNHSTVLNRMLKNDSCVFGSPQEFLENFGSNPFKFLDGLTAFRYVNRRLLDADKPEAYDELIKKRLLSGQEPFKKH